MATLPDPRRERFCQLIALGKRPAEVGRELDIPSGTVGTWCATPQVKRRIKEIKAASARKTVMDRTRKLERLSEIAESGLKEPVTGREAVMAIAELNRMEGDYAPEKHWERREVIVRVVYEDEPKKLEEAQDIGVKE